MADRPWVCIDRPPPPRLLDKAYAKAVEANPANRRSAFEAAAFTAKLWPPGSRLRISFLDGSPEVHELVARHAREWSRHANLTLEFIDDLDGEIRISFLEPDAWSAIGTDALLEELFEIDQPTMNLGWLTAETPDEEASRVVLHEFGHALGMLHEHQNPGHRIRWNKPVIYQALAQSPNYWDAETVDRNFFETYDRTQTQFTAFDPLSIMVYVVPKAWTLDGQTFPENSKLSEEDKRFIGARYPAVR
jgi:serralysin